MLSVLAIALLASPAFAEHDDPDLRSMQPQQAPQGQTDEQQAKETQKLLESCMQQIAKLHRRIGNLQDDLAGKRAAPSVREELKKVEQALKEANQTLRALQIF